MSILVNILVAILGLTLVFGGFVGWLIKLVISKKRTVKDDVHTMVQKEVHRTFFHKTFFHKFHKEVS